MVTGSSSISRALCRWEMGSLSTNEPAEQRGALLRGGVCYQKDSSTRRNDEESGYNLGRDNSEGKCGVRGGHCEARVEPYESTQGDIDPRAGRRWP